MEFYTCIAKYTFFGIRDEKLLASTRKSWYHSMVCSGIEAVITGLTRNHVISPQKCIFIHGSVSKWL